MRRPTVLTSAQLADHGLGERDIARRVRSGVLRRVRPGWYAEAGADPEELLAVSFGGALTCVSALRKYRLWVPSGRELHLRPGRTTPAQPPAPLVRCGPGARRRLLTALVPLPEALAAALRCQPPETGVVLLDSVLNRGLLPEAEVAALVAATSQRARRVLDRYDGRAQSGTESLVRVRLQSLGVRVRPQVSIPGVGRVDLVVGERLVIECDSRSFHTGWERYAEDRRRDAELLRQGYLVLRLTYEDVVHQWPATCALILSLVRSDRHRGPLRTA